MELIQRLLLLVRTHLLARGNEMVKWRVPALEKKGRLFTDI